MSTDLTIFQFEHQQVRTITDEQGNPWFVARDVAACLGYDQTANGLKHCKYSSNLNEINKISNLAPATKWIPESDVYRMVLKSHLPSAEKFQDWLVEDALPQIRKTGSYSLPATSPTQIPVLEQQEREIALCERAYNFSVRCDDPVLKVMLMDRAKNVLMNQTALPSSQSAYFQTHQVLEDLGLTSAEIRKLGSNAGKRLRSAYKTLVGKEPEKVDRIIDGTARKVNAFPSSFRDDAQAVLAEWMANS